MDTNSGQPSTWLLKNSDGKPDFLFTILTYAFILLTFITLMWIAFGCLGVLYADKQVQSENVLKIMSDMKTGLISLAGLVFGLAGSYTVRRYKKDMLEYKNKQFETCDESGEDEDMDTEIAPVSKQHVTFVSDSEDI